MGQYGLDSSGSG